MDIQISYVTLDVYPQPGSDAFRTWCGAVVDCWIRSDICMGGSPVSVAAARVGEVGWSVAQVLSRNEVSPEKYVNEPEMLKFFNQARIDGFVAHFHVSSRVTIGDGDLSNEDMGADPGLHRIP